MAETNPELQAKLQELEHELEEGDITQKGSVPVPLHAQTLSCCCSYCCYCRHCCRRIVYYAHLR